MIGTLYPCLLVRDGVHGTLTIFRDGDALVDALFEYRDYGPTPARIIELDCDDNKKISAAFKKGAAFVECDWHFWRKKYRDQFARD